MHFESNQSYRCVHFFFGKQILLLTANLKKNSKSCTLDYRNFSSINFFLAIAFRYRTEVEVETDTGMKSCE